MNLPRNFLMNLNNCYKKTFFDEFKELMLRKVLENKWKNIIKFI